MRKTGDGWRASNRGKAACWRFFAISAGDYFLYASPRGISAREDRRRSRIFCTGIGMAFRRSNENNCALKSASSSPADRRRFSATATGDFKLEEHLGAGLDSAPPSSQNAERPRALMRSRSYRYKFGESCRVDRLKSVAGPRRASCSIMT